VEAPEGGIMNVIIQYYGPIGFGVVAVIALTIVFIKVWKAVIQPNLDISQEQSKNLVQVSHNLKETAVFQDRSLERVERITASLERSQQ
jgi:hypothetical protein